MKFIELTLYSDNSKVIINTDMIIYFFETEKTQYRMRKNVTTIYMLNKNEPLEVDETINDINIKIKKQ